MGMGRKRTWQEDQGKSDDQTREQKRRQEIWEEPRCWTSGWQDAFTKPIVFYLIKKLHQNISAHKILGNIYVIEKFAEQGEGKPAPFLISTTFLWNKKYLIFLSIFWYSCDHSFNEYLLTVYIPSPIGVLGIQQWTNSFWPLIQLILSWGT